MSDYLVWSFEHGRWWRPGERGYTPNFEEAGRYTLEQAQKICAKANYLGINEAIVPLGEHTLDGERRRTRPVVVPRCPDE